ncbi:hypothetical protein B0H14DRAFT_2588374 [Mycena olivaceomarginata]|nr:hypothetical protein B0H14DRAFT_2588374 [Mycena olivaceomarginata]
MPPPKFPFALAYPIKESISPAAPWSEQEIFDNVPRCPGGGTSTRFRTRRPLLGGPSRVQKGPPNSTGSSSRRIVHSLSTVTPKEAGFGTIYPLFPPPSINEPIPRISVSDLSARRWLCASAELIEWQARKIILKQILDRTGSPRLCSQAEILLSLCSFPFLPNVEVFVVDKQGNTIDSENVDFLPLSFFTDLFLAMSDLERICKVPHGNLFARSILVSEEVNLTAIDPGNPGYDYPGDHQALSNLSVAEDVSKKITSYPDRKAVTWARINFKKIGRLQSGDGRPTAIFFYLLAEFCFAGDIKSKKSTVSSSA